MEICRINALKHILRIPSKDSSKDTMLEECLESAVELVGGLLGAQGITFPEKSPDCLTQATNFFAAWEYQRKKKLAKADVFWIKGDGLLCSYTDQFCHGSITFGPRDNPGVQVANGR